MNKDLLLMNDMYISCPSYRFRVDFNENYKELCRIINTDYELYYEGKYEDDAIEYAREKADYDKYNDILKILKEMIYMIWNCWDYIEKFPKEELYMVLNVVNLAKNEVDIIYRIESIPYAKKISISKEFQNLCQNYKNLR